MLVCVCVCVPSVYQTSLCDVNCNKSWLTICHGVHVQYLVESLSISSTHRRSVLVLQMSLICNKEMTVFNLQKVYSIKTGKRDISECKFLRKNIIILFNVFRAGNHWINIEISLEGSGKELVAMGKCRLYITFIAAI